MLRLLHSGEDRPEGCPNQMTRKHLSSFGRLVNTLITAGGLPLYFGVAACVYVGEAGGSDYVTFEHGDFVKDSTIARRAREYCSRYGRHAVLVQGEMEMTKFRCVEALQVAKPLPK